jgi:hypothetical protein
MGHIVEDLRNEELHSEMIYIYEEGVEGSIGEFGSNSLNKEGSEENTVEAMKRLVVKKVLNKIRRTITKGMHTKVMTQCMDMV